MVYNDMWYMVDRQETVICVHGEERGDKLYRYMEVTCTYIAIVH